MTKKISQLAAAGSVSGSDLAYIVQGGASKSASVSQLLASVPNRAQIVTTRNAMFNSSRQGTAGSRTDVRIENRLKFYTGAQAASQLQTVFPSFQLKSTGEAALGNDFIWESALEITSPACSIEQFANNTNLLTINSTTQGAPHALSSRCGLDVAADSFLYLRQAISVSADTLFIPNSSEGLASGDTGFISPSTSSQVPATGAMTSPGGGTSFSGPYGIILGVPAAPMAAVAFVGDSIPDGTGDSMNSNGSIGFIARGLESVNSHAIPYLRQTVGSWSFGNATIDKAPRLRSLWPYVTHVIFQLGTNDIAASGANLSAMQAFITNMCTAARRVIGPYGKPLQTAVCTLFPRTTSTDSWATGANQTPVTGFTVGGTRDNYNSWLKAQAGAGLIDKVIDGCPYVEDSNNPGKWITNGSANYPTTDGIHPTSALHVLAAQAVTSWAASITP